MQWTEQPSGDAALAERVLRVRQKLEAVHAASEGRFPARRALPGAAAQLPALRPTLSEQAVAAFEAEHAVRLPSAYRAFLRFVGNGGAGPYFGMLPLARWDWASGGEGPIVPIPRRGYLSSLCPLTPRAPRGDGWQHDLPPFEWEPYQGTLALANQGGNRFALLVVSGAARGRVVNVDRYEDEPPCFTADRDVLAWYERWLDDTLAGRVESWARPDLSSCGCDDAVLA